MAQNNPDRDPTKENLIRPVAGAGDQPQLSQPQSLLNISRRTSVISDRAVGTRAGVKISGTGGAENQHAGTGAIGDQFAGTSEYQVARAGARGNQVTGTGAGENQVSGAGPTGNEVTQTRTGENQATGTGDDGIEVMEMRNRRKINPFEMLPDELLTTIFAEISSTADSPSDLMNLLPVCRRFNRLVKDASVLSVASEKCLRIRAHKWCEQAHWFLRHCVDAGNVEACYILGMINFYALGDRRTGMELMKRAASYRHAEALYSLAVIKFNGSGGSRDDRDPHTGAGICHYAYAHGAATIDATRELAFCLQDGYGIEKCFFLGKTLQFFAAGQEEGLENHFHVGNEFLCGWFATRKDKLEQKGLGLCSHDECGRAETRIGEFKRCSACMVAIYFSRSCQLKHWRKRHMNDCPRLM